MSYEKQESARDIVRCIAHLERQRRRYLDEHLSGKKLHGSMFLMMLFLDRNPGSMQEDLCSFLGIDKSGVARKCRSLEDLGYLRREQSQQNRRQNRLYITDSGRELLPLIRELLSKWRDIVTDGMDEQEQKQLLKLLELMMENALGKHS